jgi:hypothetical protein
MKRTTLTDKQIAYHKSLIKRLHIAKSAAGMDDDTYYCFLFEFGVESSLEMSIDQLNEAINLLENKKQVKIQTKEEKETDMWRKRVMAAIGGFLEAINKESNADYIKGIACQCTSYKHFNQIPDSRLQDLYFTFLKKQKAIHKIDFVTSELIVGLTTLN